MQVAIDTLTQLFGLHLTQLRRWKIAGTLVEVTTPGGTTRRRLFGVCPLVQHIATLPRLPDGVIREAQEYLTEVGLAHRNERTDEVIFDASTPEGRAAVLGWLAGMLAGLETYDDPPFRWRVAENDCGISLSTGAPESD